MKRYLSLFVLILIVGLATNAQALLFTFSGSDADGTGTATMDISILGTTLTAVINNTSPITLDDESGVNSPGITAFGFDLIDPDMFEFLSWNLTALDDEDELVTIGGDGAISEDWELTEDSNTSGIKLAYVPNTDQAVQGALYNPLVESGEAALPNYYTEAILTMTFIIDASTPDVASAFDVASTSDDDPTLSISEDSLIVRMQNVGLDGEGSLKLSTSAPVPEPATMLLFGCGLIGLAVVGRKKFQ